MSTISNDPTEQLCGASDTRSTVFCRLTPQNDGQHEVLVPLVAFINSKVKFPYLRVENVPTHDEGALFYGTALGVYVGSL